ncbi:hypothetical protein DFH28DRAFT_490888 [Melampsora americana]|nr:hypothetical protein DFH28DRAFT_490888 [Melampsora americana]
MEIHDNTPNSVEEGFLDTAKGNRTPSQSSRLTQMVSTSGKRTKGAKGKKGKSSRKNITDKSKITVDAPIDGTEKNKKVITEEQVDYSNLSIVQFFRHVLQDQNKSFGLRMDLEEAAIQYLENAKEDQQGILNAIRKTRDDFWNVDEGAMRSISYLLKLTSFTIKQTWELYGSVLLPRTQRICKLLKADEVMPTFEKATQAEWNELIVELASLKKEATNADSDAKEIYEQLIELFEGTLDNRLATFDLMIHTNVARESSILRRVLREGAHLEGVSLPVLAGISEVLELSSDNIYWDSFSKEQIGKKVNQLINIMNGKVTLHNGQMFQIYDHPWINEYTRYYLTCPTTFISKRFQLRFKKLATLADRMNGSASKRNTMDYTNITLGDILVSVHLNLKTEYIEEMKQYFATQKRSRTCTSTGRVGCWTSGLQDMPMSRVFRFKQYFDLLGHRVHNFND